jgi:hypothetical protein
VFGLPRVSEQEWNSRLTPDVASKPATEQSTDGTPSAVREYQKVTYNYNESTLPVDALSTIPDVIVYVSESKKSTVCRSLAHAFVHTPEMHSPLCYSLTVRCPRRVRGLPAHSYRWPQAPHRAVGGGTGPHYLPISAGPSALQTYVLHHYRAVADAV